MACGRRESAVRVQVQSAPRSRRIVARRVHVVKFGSDFDQNLARVAWPQGLREIMLCARFNSPISEEVWPLGLEVLVLGRAFNQPIAGTVWPPGLKRVVFGGMFNQRMDVIRLPSS